MLNVLKIPATYLFHDGGPYHIETIPLICSANDGLVSMWWGHPSWKA